ncbi:MAG: hypothetical protein HY392_05015 [Candidatus Diapherotrites archaeon]|nr:hypothetical protein [Candidatus Diapherotrites archaeon]
MKKFPKIDLKELEEDKKRNHEQRLEFVRIYAKWVKKTPNKVWSKQHKEFIDN